MSGRPILDFDVVREPWNTYELVDGVKVKIKVIITKIRKIQTDEKTSNYNFDVQQLAVALSEERGPPDTKIYTPQDLQEATVKNDIRYTTVSEEWNEYVSDDGARLRIKATLSRVSKTSKFDRNGEPIYFTETGILTQVRPPAP